MRLRRFFLGVGTLGLCATGIERYSGAAPTEVDIDGYGGSTSGGWVCGPSADVKYGGAGGGVRVHPLSAPTSTEPGERPPPPASSVPDPIEARAPERREPMGEPHGLEIAAFGGAESRSFKLRSPGGIDDDDRTVPPTRVLGAGRVEAGYDARYVGVRAGVVGFQRWAHNDARDPALLVLPTLDLRFGRLNNIYGGFGFGSWSTSTTFRPTGYLSLGFGDPTFGVELRGGAGFVFDGEGGFRGDLRAHYALDETFAIGAGVALQTDRFLPEGTGFLIITP